MRMRIDPLCSVLRSLYSNQQQPRSLTVQASRSSTPPLLAWSRCPFLAFAPALVAPAVQPPTNSALAGTLAPFIGPIHAPTPPPLTLTLAHPPLHPFAPRSPLNLPLFRFPKHFSHFALYALFLVAGPYLERLLLLHRRPSQKPGSLYSFRDDLFDHRHTIDQIRSDQQSPRSCL